MRLITIGNDKIKPCPGPVECTSTASVDVNLTSSRQLEGLTLEHVFSQCEDVLMALATCELHGDLKLTKQSNLSNNR